MLVAAFPVLGYCATLVSDTTMADVLLAGMVLTAFGAWRRWGRFRGEKNLNNRLGFAISGGFSRVADVNRASVATSSIYS